MRSTRGRSSRLSVLVVGVILALGLGACVDKGPPSTEEQMRSMGLPLENLLTVDKQTQVTVRLGKGGPELLIFTPDRFGGSDLGVSPATRPTAHGGMAGEASSPGIFDDAEHAFGPGYQYLFGAGQGPIGQIVADAPEARTQIVNPDIDGWVIAVPETTGTYALHWQLVGPDGKVMYESVGLGLPDAGMRVDKETRAWIRVTNGIPELLVYTSNDYGGAQLAVTPADHPTINGGMVGTATSRGFRYLFGAGQGQLKRGDGVHVSSEGAQAEIVDDVNGGWVIAIPEATASDDVEWWLASADGGIALYGVGVNASAVFVANHTDEAVTVFLVTAAGDEIPLVTAAPGQQRLVLAGGQLDDPGFGVDGCTATDLVARGPGGREVARRPPPLCAATLDTWVVGPSSSPGASPAGS